MDLILIEWEDIESRVGWCEDDTDIDPPVFYTVGYLVKKTKKKLIMCDTEPGTGNVTVFPMGCVRDVKVLDRFKFDGKI